MSNKTFDKPLDFSYLVKSCRYALLQAYSLKRINEDKDIKWNGPLPKNDLHVCFPIPDRLTADYLKQSLEDQGRDALTEIIGVILTVGIEQGMALQKESILSSSVLEILKLSLEDDQPDKRILEIVLSGLERQLRG